MLRSFNLIYVQQECRVVNDALRESRRLLCARYIYRQKDRITDQYYVVPLDILCTLE